MGAEGRLLWRPLGLPDVPDLAALLAEAEEVDRTRVLHGTGSLAEQLADPAIEPAADTLACFSGGERELAGYAKLLPRPSSVGAASVMLEGVVRPRLRGRGIGSRLVRWQADRGARWLSERHPDLPAELHVQVHEPNGAKRALYERHGFTARRKFFQMVCDLATEPAGEVADPAGLTVVPFAPEYDARTHAAYLAAMEGRWPPVAARRATWRRWHTGTRIFRPGLSFLALSGAGPGATVVGYLLGADYEAELPAEGGRVAWGNDFGTRPQWRGRGVGSALIGRFLAAARAAGYARVIGGIDHANPTGVRHMSEQHGFVPAQTVIRYVRDGGTG